MDNMVPPERILRHGIPGELDQLPKGTLCEVHMPSAKIEMYEQRSEDTSNPKWVLITWQTEL